MSRLLLGVRFNVSSIWEYSRVVLSRLKQCSGDNDRDTVKVALEILQEDRENTDSNSGLSAQLLKADA